MNDLGIENLTDIREIGRGGFSVVYSATNTLLGTRVAVKVLDGLSDETDRRSFERECQVMGRLSRHPNVVTVYHAGYASDGSPYLVMELVEGGSLADRLARTGPLAWPEAVDMTVPIAEALAYVHEAGILHRDIKPENILIGSRGEALLTDFGIARHGDSATNTSTGIAASWLHAPPETFDNRREERSDLYSLASTLHQLITGTPPFWRGSEDSLNPLMYRLVNEPAPRLPAGLVPDELANLVERSLAKVPTDRPPGLQSLAADLTTIRNSIAPATRVLIPPRPAGPIGGFNPDARAAAASPPEWFGPDSRTMAADGHVASANDLQPAAGSNNTKVVVAVLASAVAAVVLSGVGLVAFLGLRGTDGVSATADTVVIPQVSAPDISAPDISVPDLSSTTAPAGTSTDRRLATVIDRGVLNCGVNGALPLFGLETATAPTAVSTSTSAGWSPPLSWAMQRRSNTSRYRPLNGSRLCSVAT